MAFVIRLVSSSFQIVFRDSFDTLFAIHFISWLLLLLQFGVKLANMCGVFLWMVCLILFILFECITATFLILSVLRCLLKMQYIYIYIYKELP